MSNSRLAAALVLLFLATFAAPLPALQAQPAPEPDKKQEAIQKIQKLLDTQLIETRHFQKEMPLAKFLDALEKQLPKDKKVALRIDKVAFGDKFAEVAAAPTRLHLQPTPQMMSLREILEWIINQGQYPVGVDFRIGITEVAITTIQRAQYTAVHDIRTMMKQPIIWTFSGPGLGDFKANQPRTNPKSRADCPGSLFCFEGTGAPYSRSRAHPNFEWNPAGNSYHRAGARPGRRLATLR